MNGKNIIFLQGLFAGILLCVVVYSAYVYLPNLLKEKHPGISFEQALTKIKSGQASEIHVKQDVLEITDQNQEILTVKIDAGEVGEEKILAAAKDTSAKIIMEPAEKSSRWFILADPSVLIVIFGTLIIFTVIYLNHLNNKVEK